MGVRLRNIITNYTSEEDEKFLGEFERSFQFIQVKKFNSQFKGVIGQIDEGKVEDKCYEDANFLKQNKCSDLDDIFEIIYEFEDKIKDFSKKFPHKKFAYVNVDCFGGNCRYDGFVVKGGQFLRIQEPSLNGHIKLLEKLDDSFKDWNFEPFTRDFFTKKGELKGIIYNFSIAGLWLTLKTDFADTKKYYIDGGSNSLIFRCRNQYYYYFESSNQHIKVSGVIYDDTDEVINEVTGIPDISFLGMRYELAIRLLEKNNLIEKASGGSNDRNPTNGSKKLTKKRKATFWSKLKGLWT